MLYEEPKVIEDAESTNVLFTNWTTEEFIGRWNKNDRKVKAGQSLLLPKYLARHYAHQLAMDEMNREEISLINRDKYEAYFNKAMSEEEKAENSEDAEVERLNKKPAKKIKKEEVNEDFEDESPEKESSTK